MGTKIFHSSILCIGKDLKIKCNTSNNGKSRILVLGRIFLREKYMNFIKILETNNYNLKFFFYNIKVPKLYMDFKKFWGYMAPPAPPCMQARVSTVDSCEYSTLHYATRRNTCSDNKSDN